MGILEDYLKEIGDATGRATTEDANAATPETLIPRESIAADLDTIANNLAAIEAMYT